MYRLLIEHIISFTKSLNTLDN